MFKARIGRLRLPKNAKRLSIFLFGRFRANRWADDCSAREAAAREFPNDNPRFSAGRQPDVTCGGVVLEGSLLRSLKESEDIT